MIVWARIYSEVEFVGFWLSWFLETLGTAQSAAVTSRSLYKPCTRRLGGIFPLDFVRSVSDRWQGKEIKKTKSQLAQIWSSCESTARVNPSLVWTSTHTRSGFPCEFHSHLTPSLHLAYRKQPWFWSSSPKLKLMCINCSCESKSRVNFLSYVKWLAMWIPFACDFHFPFNIASCAGHMLKSLESASNSARPDSSARVNSCSPRFACSCEFIPAQILLLVWIHARPDSSARVNSCSPRFFCPCGWCLLKSAGSKLLEGASNSARPDSSARVNSCSPRFACSCEFIPAQILLLVWIHARPVSSARVNSCSPRLFCPCGLYLPKSAV